MLSTMKWRNSKLNLTNNVADSTVQPQRYKVRLYSSIHLLLNGSRCMIVDVESILGTPINVRKLIFSNLPFYI